VQATFRTARCTPCPDRARCTRAPTNPRHLTFRPRLQYETQHSIRAEQATPAWQNRYAHRSGIEGTIAQAPTAVMSIGPATAACPRPTCSTC
jgi:Transposase DDE domain